MNTEPDRVGQAYQPASEPGLPARCSCVRARRLAPPKCLSSSPSKRTMNSRRRRTGFRQFVVDGGVEDRRNTGLVSPVHRQAVKPALHF